MRQPQLCEAELESKVTIGLGEWSLLGVAQRPCESLTLAPSVLKCEEIGWVNLGLINLDLPTFRYSLNNYD